MLLPLLATLALTHPAHAIHAYHSGWCHSKGGAIQLRANYDWSEATPKGAEQGGGHSLTGSVVADAAHEIAQGEEFTVVKTKVVNLKTKSYDDGCWTGSNGTYTAVLVIEKVSPKAAAMGMKEGMQVPVSCTTEDIDPDGPGC